MRVRLNIAKVVGTLQPTQTKDLLSPKVTLQSPKVTYCEKNSAHGASEVFQRRINVRVAYIPKSPGRKGD
jgi:hypothetical protein